MENKKVNISDDMLEQVVGGVFDWAPKYNKMRYTREDGTVRVYKVKDYENAYSTSCSLHAQHVPEDDIIDQLIGAGYIEG